MLINGCPGMEPAVTRGHTVEEHCWPNHACWVQGYPPASLHRHQKAQGVQLPSCILAETPLHLQCSKWDGPACSHSSNGQTALCVTDDDGLTAYM